MDSSCGEEELSPLVHHPTCGLSKLKNGSAWSSYPGHRDPWKGKGQKRPLPTPFCRRDARRYWIIVAPQRPLRHYYYSRKAEYRLLLGKGMFGLSTGCYFHFV
ncbi:PREDICTED: uncharacterized protein LOC108754612 [Trachymyrmex septentrionalis]|uniref:uncharacterized protein LOC108754612 n=1 Tax=Trachymyrmex septentrionalis TaxID=34720 RepID=UPI00084F51CC|nr:PREDICTED: uncharacterized protein LOC108754612 [Trachymyrmex septentrionalis]